MKKFLIIIGIIAIGFLIYLFIFNRDIKLSCDVDDDCMLVQDSYCKGILAINKKQEALWKIQDIISTKGARINQQTCKVSTKETSNSNNYSATCMNSKCKALYNPPKTMEINDETVCFSDNECWCRSFDGARFYDEKVPNKCDLEKNHCFPCYYK